MKTLLASMHILIATVVVVFGAERPRPTRVPPPGIQIAEADRVELQSGVEALGREIASLRKSLARHGDMLALLPDVEIFHKAVEWPLRYDEFYRSNEVGIARSLLKQGAERARLLRQGQAPWLMTTGLIVRGYVSKIDGSIQPYGLVVPTTFSSNQRQPRRLDVWLHGRDNNLTELKFIADRQKSYGEFAPPDTIVLHPYGRYCNAFKFAGEVDVFEAMEHVKKFYPIDTSRIALRGFSMGGAGVWHLAAHYPDVWAVAAPGAGFAETAEYQKLGTNRSKFPWWEQKLWQLYDTTDYAANFFNLPVVAYNGTDDPQRQAADVMERSLQAEGLNLPRVWGTNVGHKYTADAKREINQFVDKTMQGLGSRIGGDLPTQVHFTTRTLRYSKAPSLQVLGLNEHWKRADLIVDSGARIVNATNVTSFALETPADRFVVNGQPIKIRNPGLFRAAHERALFEQTDEGKWSAVRTPEKTLPGHKSPGLQGPIDDAFMESFIVVRPTGKAQNAAVDAWTTAHLAKATNDWRAQFRGAARVKDDSQITKADIAANNLILFGDPQSNRLVARMADKLPIKWGKQFVRVGNKEFSAATHVPVFIFPNPLNPKRYVVLNSGFTFAAAGLGSNAQQTPKLPDYAVFNVEDGRVELADFFDEQWRVK